MTEPQNPAEAPELDELAADPEEQPAEISIDDALETDRGVAEGPDSRNADGYGFDGDVERGTDDATAAEQGNRDEDRMDAELPEEELPEQ